VTQGIFGSFSNATTYSNNGESITISLSGSTLRLTGFSTALSGVQTFTHSAGTVGTWNGIIIQSFTIDLGGITPSGTLTGSFNVPASAEYEAQTFSDLTSPISIADFRLKGNNP
jgi:hypothetical protein